MLTRTQSQQFMAVLLAAALGSSLIAAEDPATLGSGDSARILFRKALPQGLSVEINNLGPYRYIQVHFREKAGDFANDDPTLGDWSLLIPELIGNSDGFVFGLDSRNHWAPVLGKPNAIFHENESVPIGPSDPVAFAGLREMINRRGRLKYRAEVTVTSDKLDIELAITNLEEKPTSFYTDICNRFHGRGNVWGWEDRTFVNVANKWILARRLISGDGFPAGTRWFVKGHLPSPSYMHEFRRGSHNEPSSHIMSSPYICMPLQDERFTVIYGSPQGSMIFFNPTNPCTHSDAWTADVAPGETIVQKTVLRVYQLPMKAAIAKFEDEMAL